MARRKPLRPSTKVPDRANAQRTFLESRPAPSGLRFNINHEVWVRLTKHGEDVYDKHYLGSNVPALCGHDGYVRFRLWQLAAIFGGAIYNGSEPVFDTEIVLAADGAFRPGDPVAVAVPALSEPAPQDAINAPAHYIEGRKYEPVDVIVDWGLPYLLGNVVKYLSRAGRKVRSSYLSDLLKAEFYLKRAIAQVQDSATKAKE